MGELYLKQCAGTDCDPLRTSMTQQCVLPSDQCHSPTSSIKAHLLAQPFPVGTNNVTWRGRPWELPPLAPASSSAPCVVFGACTQKLSLTCHLPQLEAWGSPQGTCGGFACKHRYGKPSTQTLNFGQVKSGFPVPPRTKYQHSFAEIRSLQSAYVTAPLPATAIPHPPAPCCTGDRVKVIEIIYDPIEYPRHPAMAADLQLLFQGPAAVDNAWTHLMLIQGRAYSGDSQFFHSSSMHWKSREPAGIVQEQQVNKKQPGKSTEKIKIQRRNTHSFPSSRTEQKTSSGSEHILTAFVFAFKQVILLPAKSLFKQLVQAQKLFQQPACCRRPHDYSAREWEPAKPELCHYIKCLLAHNIAVTCMMIFITVLRTLMDYRTDKVFLGLRRVRSISAPFVNKSEQHLQWKADGKKQQLNYLGYDCSHSLQALTVYLLKLCSSDLSCTSRKGCGMQLEFLLFSTFHTREPTARKLKKWRIHLPQCYGPVHNGPVQKHENHALWLERMRESEGKDNKAV
ncbi:hypothetical protein Anapl_17819 [Anas platyrhynchos]|uniref:Uncharacterized protein n=1 Tax=Anas platyrhynchos TaxID=8839 RepID=R0JBT3_ANAPL|nr:hypothetical protein Anapl_17819 [Anas platyrhynchos]